jgi:sulfatase modifying factor 1
MRALFIYSIIVILCSCSGQKKQNAKNGEATIPEPSEEEPAPVKNESTLTNVFTETATEPEMVFFEGGTFKMGSENGLPNERPVHEVTISPFYIDKTPVTTEQFSRFIKASGYKTEAEKFGDSGVFNLDRQAWELLPGAYWEKPLGPSGPDAEPNHPVTHVSWNDAVAYASWAEKRLPTEAEWEYAARSGKDSGNRFSWGNSVTTDGIYHANTWQGTIDTPEVLDGYLFTSPVGAFEPNEAGLTDMGGNVWQWCADNYKPYPGNNEPFREDPNIKVIRSGSFFYDQNGELSFTVSGRAMNSIETSLFNTGFRCAKDAPE